MEKLSASCGNFSAPFGPSHNFTDSQRPNFNQTQPLTNLLTNPEGSLRTFRSGCQLFLPARSRRPSWFSPLNQILGGRRRRGSGGSARWKFPSRATRRRDDFHRTIAHLPHTGPPVPSSHRFLLDADSPSRRLDWRSRTQGAVSRRRWRWAIPGAWYRYDTE